MTGTGTSSSTFISSSTPPVTLKLTVYAGDNSAFPVQTKGASVFISGAGAGAGKEKKVGLVLGAVGLALLL